MPKSKERTTKCRRITRRRFTVIEKVAILERLRIGTSVPDVAKEFGRPDASIYRIKRDEQTRSGTYNGVDTGAGAGVGAAIGELRSSEESLVKMGDKKCIGNQEPCAITFPKIKEEIKWDPEELEALASSYMAISDVCAEVAQSQPSVQASWQHPSNFDVIDLTREESQSEEMLDMKQAKLQHVATEAKNEPSVYSNPNKICQRLSSKEKELAIEKKSESKNTLKGSVFDVNSEGKGKSTVKKRVVSQEITNSKEKPCSCASGKELCLLHPNRKRHFCSLCGAMFLWKDYLDKHMTSHAEEMPYSCSICSVKFRLQESLEKHMRFHPDCKSTSCRVGSKRKSKSNTPTTLDVLGPRFGCAICQMRFLLKDQLRSHLAVHQDRKLFCGVCQAQFSLEEELFQHVETHLYTCNVCSMVLTSQQHLDSHMCTHSTKNFPCSTCTVSFSSNKLLKWHMVVSHSRSEQGSLGSSTEIQPVSGVIIYHRGASVNSCSQDVADSLEGQSFSSHVSLPPDNQSLRVHTTSGVTIFKNFFDHTSQNSQNSGILVRYEETHNSSTNKSETWDSSVGNQHMKVQQLEKRFCCLLCNARFEQQFILDNHMEISHSLEYTRRKGKTGK